MRFILFFSFALLFILILLSTYFRILSNKHFIMLSSSTRINPSTSSHSPHLFFKRSSFRRPLALILSIAILGYGARYITVTEYKKIYDKRELERKERVNDVSRLTNIRYN